MNMTRKWEELRKKPFKKFKLFKFRIKLSLNTEIEEKKVLKRDFEAKEAKIIELNKLIEKRNSELQEKDSFFDKVFFIIIKNSAFF